MIISDAGPPQVNGVVTTLNNTIRELQRVGCAVEFVTPNTFLKVPYPFYREIDIPVWPRRQINERIDTFLRYPGPHAFHISTESSLGLTASLILRKRGLKFTTCFHTDFPSYAYEHFNIPSEWTWRYMRWFHNRAARVLYATDKIRDLLVENGVENNLSRWERGFDEQIFFNSDRLPDEPPIYLYGGRVSFEKNIEAFLKLKLPGTVIAGDGPARKGLERVYPHASFVGMLSQTEMADWMRRATVFVFPSRTDTFGIVMVEAMACGTPVAGFPCQGPLDVVDMGVTGWLDENLELAIENATKIKRQKVSERAAERFSWKICTDQFRNNLIVAKL